MNDTSISEFDDSIIKNLLNSIIAIENDLERFRINIAPQISKLGYRITAESLKLSANLQQTATTQYNSILNKISSQGGKYTTTDLYEFNAALNNKRTVQRFNKYLAIANVLYWIGGKLYIKFKTFLAKRKILGYIEDEKEKIPQLYSFFDKIDKSRKQNLIIKLKILKDNGKKIVHDKDVRQHLHLRFEKLVDSLKKCYEIKSKIDYYKNIYNALEEFDSENFKDSLENLLKEGFGKKALYAINSLNYINHIDDCLKVQKWDSPYYENGLPEILIFSIQNKNNREVFPRKYKSPVLEQNIRRIQKDTIKVFSPRDIKKAFSYSRNHLGKITTPFKFHFLLLATLILITILMIIFYLYQPFNFIP